MLLCEDLLNVHQASCHQFRNSLELDLVSRELSYEHRATLINTKDHKALILLMKMLRPEQKISISSPLKSAIPRTSFLDRGNCGFVVQRGTIV